MKQTMKQTMKRLLVCTMAILMLMTLPVTTKAQAEVKDNLPKIARIYTSSYPWSRSVQLTLADAEQSIENVKSGSKNLKAELVRRNTSVSKIDGSVLNNSYEIGLLPFKDGVYTVTYDVVKDDKVISTRTMKVYAYPSPIKSVTLDGKTDSYYWNKTKGKVKVTLTSGNTIKKLEVGAYKMTTDKNSGQKRTEVTYKTFKNGDSVNLGTAAYYYYKNEQGDRLKDESYYGNLSSSLKSDTRIKITYKDKYTEQEETIYAAFYGLAK